MYRTPRAGAVGLLPLLLLLGCAGHPVEPKSWALDEDAFREHVRVLTSSDFDGRRPGTAGAERTVAYLAETFKSLGLKPGNGNDFTQAVPLLEIIPEGTPQLGFAVQGRRLALAYGREAVIWSVASRVDVADSEVVFAGHGVVAPELGWDDYGALDVRGKTVILLSGHPGFSGGGTAALKGMAASKHVRWDFKLREASRRGAAAVLIVHDERGTGLPWGAVQAAGMGPRLAPDNANGGDGPSTVEGWISGGAARSLLSSAGYDLQQLSAAASQRGFTARTLALRASVQIRNRIRATSAANVLALLPGRERPHEYVFYVAHWDHLGTRAGADGAEQMYPGAVDNASGVAALLTLAQSLSRMPERPARSIVFLCSTAAESGSLGSAWYAGHPVYPLKNTAAVIDIEQLHPGGPARDVSVPGLGSSELETYLRFAALLQGRELHADPAAADGGGFGAEAYSFAAAGVPVLMAHAGFDDTARGPLWGKAQDDEYRQRRYHQPADRYAADWDVRGILQDLDLYLSVGLRIAHDWRFPNWLPSSEFRALRERQRPEDAAGRPLPSE